MTIHECARCEGCGYITGAFRWEIPWSRWAGPNGESESGFLEAHACPDCGGTGALIRLDAVPAMGPKLASRRGLPRSNAYAHHVELVLRSQHAAKH